MHTKLLHTYIHTTFLHAYIHKKLNAYTPPIPKKLLHMNEHKIFTHTHTHKSLTQIHTTYAYKIIAHKHAHNIFADINTQSINTYTLSIPKNYYTHVCTQKNFTNTCTQIINTHTHQLRVWHTQTFVFWHSLGHRFAILVVLAKRKYSWVYEVENICQPMILHPRVERGTVIGSCFGFIFGESS